MGKKKIIKCQANHSKVMLINRNKSPKCLATPFLANGVKWEIHNHDADINNPSCPHMHAIGQPWKLDLYTGFIYHQKTGDYIGRIKKEILLSIWKAPGVMKIILAERAIYDELNKKNPARYPPLPPLLISPLKTSVKKDFNSTCSKRLSGTRSMHAPNRIVLQINAKSMRFR